MSKQKWIGTNIESLMDTLSSKDGATREKARRSLVALGKPAVSPLIQTLRNSSVAHVRWEAVKALGAIGDSRTITVLVKALEDSDPDVAWLAAEGLRKFKRIAWPPLLRALIKGGPDTVVLREGAHRVLRNQRDAEFSELLADLRKALESTTTPNAARVSAYAILERMKAEA